MWHDLARFGTVLRSREHSVGRSEHASTGCGKPAGFAPPRGFAPRGAWTEHPRKLLSDLILRSLDCGSPSWQAGQLWCVGTRRALHRRALTVGVPALAGALHSLCVRHRSGSAYPAVLNRIFFLVSRSSSNWPVSGHFPSQISFRNQSGCNQDWISQRSDPNQDAVRPRSGIRCLVCCFFVRRPSRWEKVVATKKRRVRKSPANLPIASPFCVLCAFSRLHSPVPLSFVLRPSSFVLRASTFIRHSTFIRRLPFWQSGRAVGTGHLSRCTRPQRKAPAGAHRRPSP